MQRQRNTGHIIIVSRQLCNLNSVPRQTAGQVFACRGLAMLSLMHSQIYIGPGERCFLNVCLLVGICKCLRVCLCVCAGSFLCAHTTRSFYERYCFLWIFIVHISSLHSTVSCLQMTRISIILPSTVRWYANAGQRGERVVEVQDQKQTWWTCRESGHQHWEPIQEA